MEKPFVLRHIKHGKVSNDTLMNSIAQLTELAEEKIVKLLPNRIALIFDGWSRDTTHYFAMFASISSLNSKGYETRLFDLSPIGDECSLSANEHHEFLTFVLELYGLNCTNVACLIGENVSTNIALTNISNILLIGCASHCFYLAVQDILHSEQKMIDKVRTIIIKLGGLLLNARLKKLTRIQPNPSNKTRWTSAYEMLKRYVRIREYLSSRESNKLGNCCLLSPENRHIYNLWKKLEPSESVTKTL